MTKDNVRFLPAEGDEREGTHIAMTSGHACRVYKVGPDGKPGTHIPVLFRKEAIARGCGIVGIDEPKPAKIDATTKQSLIVDAIGKVLDTDNPDDLQGDGRPKIEIISELAGFSVTKKMYDDAFGVFQDSLED